MNENLQLLIMLPEAVLIAIAAAGTAGIFIGMMRQIWRAVHASDNDIIIDGDDDAS